MKWPQRYVNIVDVEATCWAGDPPLGHTAEIIEIGACVLDTDGWTRTQRYSIVVKPQHSTVSAFCTELTGWTRARVDAGVSFAEACDALQRDLRTHERPWASWGDYDRRQFERECAAAEVPYPFSALHTNLRARFTEAFGMRRPPGMDQALRHAGLPLEGRHHNGEDDAWNIAALAIVLGSKATSG
jgi:inhibitor of KinA sporulation pathway (predicted exonuclease)